MDEVWSASRRSQAEQAFRSSGLPYSAQSWQTASRLIDTYSAQWSKDRRDACASVATDPRGTAARFRLQCLDRRLEETRALVSELVSGEQSAVQQAPFAAAALPRIEECSNPTLVEKQESMKSDGDSAELVRQLARTRAAEQAGNLKLALERSREALATARKLKSGALESEALLLQGLVLRHMANPDCERTLVQAAAIASSVHHDRVAAEAYDLLVYWTAEYKKKPDEAASWAQLSQALVDQLHDDRLRADLMQDTGTMYWAKGEIPEALERWRRAAQMKEALFGDGNPILVSSISAIGVGLYNLGEADEGIKQQKRALALAQKTLGALHPKTADSAMWVGLLSSLEGRFDEALENCELAYQTFLAVHGPANPITLQTDCDVGEMLKELGRYPEALQRLLRAKAGFEKIAKEDDPIQVFVVFNLGDLALRQGEATRAVPLLERALRMAQATPGEPRLKGSIRLALAKAKEASGAGEQLALAREALRYFEQDGFKSHRFRAEAEQWIKSRGH